MIQTTYYQKNREVILNRAKYYYKNNKELLRERGKINIENYLKGKKILRDNMEKTDIIICLKKRNKG